MGEKIIAFIVGITIGVMLKMALVVNYQHTLGEDSYLMPKLIKEQCGRYDMTNGDFIIENLLREKIGDEKITNII
jgi:hypothetical protein